MEGNRLAETNSDNQPIWNLLTPRFRRTLLDGFALAQSAGEPLVWPRHLLAALCADTKSAAQFMLRHAGVDPARLATDLPPVAASAPAGPLADCFSQECLRLLHGAAQQAQQTGSRHICTEHLLLALCADSEMGPLLAKYAFTQKAARKGLAAWRRKDFITQRVGLGLEPQNRLRVKLTPGGLVGRLAAALTLPVKIFRDKSLLHPGFARNPYPLYDQLRSKAALRPDPVLPAWTAFRYADAQALLKDPRFGRGPFTMDAFSPRALAQLQAPAEPDRLFAMMLFSDPPRHTRLRGAFMRAMGAVSLAALRPAMAARAAAALLPMSQIRDGIPH